MLFKQQIEKFKSNPKRIFLIDGFGAILSAFLLGIVLVELEILFGIPPSTLYILAMFPIIFAIYNFYCYQKKVDNPRTLIIGIAIMNVLYCCLSIGLSFYHIKTITSIGWTYIIIEIMIIMILANFEFNLSKNI